MKKEMDKVFDDVKSGGFGIFDAESKVRINPNALSFLWAHKKKRHKIREEVCLHHDLMVLQRIYKKKFGSDSSLELKLYENSIELAIERLIRAVEICTLKYVLNRGGALNNLEHINIVKGKRGFLWEV